MNESALVIILIAILAVLVYALNKKPEKKDEQGNEAEKPACDKLAETPISDNIPPAEQIVVEEAISAKHEDENTETDSYTDTKTSKPVKAPGLIFRFVSSAIGMVLGIFLGTFVSLWFDIEPPSPILVLLFMAAGITVAQAICLRKEKAAKNQ